MFSLLGVLDINYPIILNLSGKLVASFNVKLSESTSNTNLMHIFY